MGLRFLIPEAIQDLCQYYGISPSQLLPNSYATLLSLGVLLKHFGLVVSVSLYLRLIFVKKIGPGRFYISPKTEHKFL